MYPVGYSIDMTEDTFAKVCPIFNIAGSISHICDHARSKVISTPDFVPT